jgi:hypothetical protein
MIITSLMMQLLIVLIFSDEQWRKGISASRTADDAVVIEETLVDLTC